MIRKGKQAAVVLMAAVILSATGVSRVAAVQPGPTVRVEPAQRQVGPNEDFLLLVTIEGIDDLGGFQFELAYDPSVLEVQDAVLGDFLGSTGRSVLPVGPEVSHDEGVVVFGAATFGEQAGPDGSGVLATITCSARGDGSSALRLRDVLVLDTAADTISVEIEQGQVVVGDAGEPAATSTATREPEPVATDTPSGAASPAPTSIPTDEPRGTATSVAPPSPTRGASSQPRETPIGTSTSEATPAASAAAAVEATPTGPATPSVSPPAGVTPTARAVAASPSLAPSTAPPETTPAPSPSVQWGWVIAGLLLVGAAAAIQAFRVLHREPEG